MRAGACDVAIAGGGPAGTAAAIILARAGLHVLVADSGPDAIDRPFKVGEGLPPPARSLLRTLGVLERVLADGHRASHGTLAFWGNETPHVNDFMFQLNGHGLQLDRVRFDASLRLAAAEAGAEMRDATHLQIEATITRRTPHHLRLRRADKTTQTIEARWLIDASGRPAILARSLGASRIEHDALLAFHLRLRSEHSADRDGRTWVEAVEDGWWYSALLPAGERLIAFLGDADLLDRRSLLDGDGLWRKLQSSTRLRALCVEHDYRPQGRAHGADASSTELNCAADHAQRWLAVGDAALAFDPLSSKGISNALYTGLRGAQTILDCERGETAAATRYAQYLRDIHRVYREQLQTFYEMERRWPASPFWVRRLTRAHPTEKRESNGAL